MVAAPGGSIVEDPDQSKVCRTDICVFGCEADRNKLKAYFEVSCDGVFKCFFFLIIESIFLCNLVVVKVQIFTIFAVIR